MKLSDLKEKIANLKNKLPDFKSGLSKLKNKLSNVKAKISNILKNKLPDFKSGLAKFKSKFSTIKTKISNTLKNMLLNLKASLSKLKNKLPDVKTKLSNLKGKLPSFNLSDSKKREILMSIMCSVVLVCFFATLFVSFRQQLDTYLKPVIAQAEEQTNEPDVAGEEINIEDLENSDEEETPSDDTEDANSAVQPVNVAGNPAPSSKNYSGSSYYIKVNYGANVVTIYTTDADGNYTVPIKAMVCSTGTATPRSGTYRIQSRWEWLALVGWVYGHYSTQITGNILFHSVPYLEKYNPASLEYWEYDKLGTSASAGCVRLTIADAKWIYNNIPRGTPVEFYSSADPGPLGKPSAQKISGNEACRDWDPTDSDPNNPWHAYNASTATKPTEPAKNNTTTTQTPTSGNTNNTTPDINVPSTSTPDINTPEPSVPENTVPDNTIPDATVPDNGVSENNNTENNTSDNGIAEISTFNNADTNNE